MQLFITEFTKDGNNIIIDEKRILHQLNNVLRAKIGDIFWVQKQVENQIQRFQVKILSIKKDEIKTQIISQNLKNIENQNFGMIICMPNKFEKAELITQKLTEIGIPNIVFWQSHRSVLKSINEAKRQRLEKIKIEAAEQSRNYTLPEIKFLKTDEITDFIKGINILFFDAEGNILSNIKINKNNLYGIIGPEGGFDAKDIEILKNNIIKKISLGENILRMETGAIIGGRILKNFQ